MNTGLVYEAVKNLGYDGPVSIEPTGEVWVGPDDNRVYVDNKKLLAEIAKIEGRIIEQREAAQNKLLALGLTLDDLRSLGL